MAGSKNALNFLPKVFGRERSRGTLTETATSGKRIESRTFGRGHHGPKTKEETQELSIVLQHFHSFEFTKHIRSVCCMHVLF